MTMALRNSARLISTALGGLCCRPSAVRSRLRTTTIRTNEVVMMTIDGASDRTVSRPISWTTRSVRPAPVPRSMLIACACAAAGSRTSSTPSSSGRTLRIGQVPGGAVGDLPALAEQQQPFGAVDLHDHHPPPGTPPQPLPPAPPPPPPPPPP